MTDREIVLQVFGEFAGRSAIATDEPFIQERMLEVARLRNEYAGDEALLLNGVRYQAQWWTIPGGNWEELYDIPPTVDQSGKVAPQTNVAIPPLGSTWPVTQAQPVVTTAAAAPTQFQKLLPWLLIGGVVYFLSQD